MIDIIPVMCLVIYLTVNVLLVGLAASVLTALKTLELEENSGAD